MTNNQPERSVDEGDRVICDGLFTGQFGKTIGVGSDEHSIKLLINGQERYEPDYCLLEVTTENKRAIELLLSHLQTERQRCEEMEKLLKIANCPDSNCNNEGTGVDGYGEPYQCQWCYKRNEVTQPPTPLTKDKE